MKKQISRIAATVTLVSYSSLIALPIGMPVVSAFAQESLGNLPGDSLNPASAPALNSVPLEPDTQFDGKRWFDQWWSTSVKGLKSIPGNFVEDFKNVGSHMEKIFTGGVKVGNTLIVRGMPDTLNILKYHGTQMGIHYRDTIKMFPEHAVAAGERFVQAGKHIGKIAAGNAADTAVVAEDQWNKFKRDQADAGELMEKTGRWMGKEYVDIAKDTYGAIKDDVTTLNDREGRIGDWTQREATESLRDTWAWMKDYSKGDWELMKRLGNWTGRQAPEGWQDTKNWTVEAAQATGRWTKTMALQTAQDTKAAVTHAGAKIEQSFEADAWIGKTGRAVLSAQNASDEFFEDALMKAAKNTFGKIPEAISSSVESEKKAASWLWERGYEKGVKQTLSDAGDQYFAGDVEGIAVGTFYGLAAGVEGVTYILVLEPLAFTGNVGVGVTKTLGLGLAGTAAGLGIGVAGLGSHAAIGVGGTALTLGVAALAKAYQAETIISQGLRIGGIAGAEGLATAGAATLGGVFTGGAALAGLGRTVGGLAVGGLATAGAAAAYVPGEVLIGGAGIVRTIGTGMAGLALSTGALALGGLEATANLGWGAVKMVGVTGLGVSAEILIPTIDTAMILGRTGIIAGNAVWNNAIETPAVATWDILTALTMGGWDLAKNPVYGTYHLVAGATGFSYRLAGMLTAEALTVTFGSLYAVAKAPLSLVYYGGMWSIAAGAKLMDGVTAPLNFTQQNHWKAERLPQLQALMDRQSESTRSEIGNEVSYIRVVFSGQDRGKVNFFTTQKGAQIYKFKREIIAENCLVVYRSKDTKTVLDSGLYDPACVQDSQSKSQK